MTTTVTSLPSRRRPGPAKPAAGATPLERLAQPPAGVPAGDSGVLALDDPADAFAARMRLAALARHKLDLQASLWRADRAGVLLLDAVRQAAERGVKVRLLLDGGEPTGGDALLTALNAHRNVRVRLFGASAARRWRAPGARVEGGGPHRWMHNRSYTADGLACIVGGRNIGDDYFGAGECGPCADLDLLAAGPVAAAVAHAFDDYWSSAAAVPFEQLVRSEGDPVALAELAAQVRSDPSSAPLLRGLRLSVLARQLDDGAAPLQWSPARLVCDSPRAARRAMPDRWTASRLREVAGRPRRSLDVLAPSFVPTQAGTEALVALARAGIAVRILTSSLAASEAAAVHAGYAHWRPQLLRGGVRLFELRRSAAAQAPPVPWHGMFGRLGAGLHARSFLADGSRLYVGSFNFDPHAAALHTDMGLVVESAGLGGRLQGAFDAAIATRAWELDLEADGRLAWLGVRDGRPQRATREPDTDVWRRMVAGGLSLLPIDGLV